MQVARLDGHGGAVGGLAAPRGEGRAAPPADVHLQGELVSRAAACVSHPQQQLFSIAERVAQRLFLQAQLVQMVHQVLVLTVP